MAKAIDVNELFTRCITGTGLESLTATTVASYITSPYSIHCNKFVSEDEKDSITEYQKLLFERGKDHEIQTVQTKYPNMTTIPFTTPEDGFRLAIESMVSGTNALHGMPIYYMPEGLFGVADILEKSKSGNSIFGNYHYTIKEVKIAKNIGENHLIQGAFYNYLLGQIQGTTPKEFVMINRDGEETLYKYTEYESLLFEAIENTRRILQGEPISPTYDSCGFPWESYCNKMAEDANDISLVAGISLKTKSKMVSYGYKTVQDLAAAKMENLTAIKGVGEKTATKYLTTAQAIQSKSPIIKNKKAIVFPKRKVEIFLDLEGTDPTMTGDEIIQVDYLIGTLVRTNSTEKYVAFVASDLYHEREMLLEFLEFIKKQKDYVIYHYHSYEKTHLSKMMEKYEVAQETRNKVFDYMIDVYKVATDSVAFPTYGNGLKKIAPFLGFNWRHKDVNATESISMYLEYAKNPSENKQNLQLILDYNEDDCIATRVIKDWLESVK